MMVKASIGFACLFAAFFAGGVGFACVPAGETAVVRLAGLSPEGDLRLADGRRLRLAGLAPMRDETGRAALAGGLEAWRETDLRLTVTALADRWGRLAGHLQVEPGEAAPVDLGLALLRAGLAWHLPEAGGSPCLAAFRVAEAEARRDGRGLWADPGAVALSGLDSAAVRAQAGRLVIVEGRIVSVGERRARTYLNFARQPGAGAAILLGQTQWRDLKAAGWTATRLRGRRARVRGVVEGASALLIAPASAAALEIFE